MKYFKKIITLPLAMFIFYFIAPIAWVFGDIKFIEKLFQPMLNAADFLQEWCNGCK